MDFGFSFGRDGNNMAQSISVIAAPNTETTHFKSKKFFQDMRRQWEYHAMILPGIVLLIIFAYIPMLGVIIAFQNYQLGDVIGFSPFVGLSNFIQFFQNPFFGTIMRNTIGISLLKLLVGFPAPIILALLFNEIHDGFFKRTMQSISYLPYFVSWVVVYSLVNAFLTPDGGTLNSLLLALHVIKTPITFLGIKNAFWGILTASSVWKEVGWNSIIYLAAMSGINPELYEAADIDGANRIQKIRYITLPGIKMAIVIILIFSVGGLLNAGYEQIILFTNSAVTNVSEIIDTYVLKMGLRQMMFSYATAIGVFKSVTSVLLLSMTNLFCRKFADTSLW